MSERLPRVTAAALMRVLERAGWYISRQSGSHAILHHRDRAGRVVVPMHRGKTLKLGTVAAILDEAGLSAEEFRRLR